MIVSADISEDIIEKIDALVCLAQPPTWPFETSTIHPDQLTPAERKTLEQYQKDFADYEIASRSGNQLRTRSAVVRHILHKFFSPKK